MDQRVEGLDSLIHELRVLRESAGVSYRELAVRITRQREADGTTSGAAYIAHTTVSDVFRLGRSRINAGLVAEIVRALGESADDAERWRTRVAVALTSGLRADRAPSMISLRGWARVLLLVAGGVLLNSTGKFLNPLAGDLLFLDMIGTAMVALVAGPIVAALVGVVFVGVELMKGETGDALFAVTMITAGLIWGCGVRRFGLGRTLPRFLALSAVVAVVTTALAVPIIVLYFGGDAGRGADGIAATITALGASPWAAVGSINLPVSLADKLLTGAIAFGIVVVISKMAPTSPGDQRSTGTRSYFETSRHR